PKDYIGKASPRDYQTGNTYDEHFLKDFDSRMQWEVYSEFSFQSLIGRTLEKTGSSSVFFDAEKIESAGEKMEDWLKENDVSQSITLEDWQRFTHLILHRERQRGAVEHPFLDKFRENDYRLWDLNWMRDTRHILNPNYGARSRMTNLLTNLSGKKGLLDST